MKIVVLDADPASGSAAAGGEDLNFSALTNLGELKIYQRTNSAECLERIADADVVVTNKVELGEKELKAAPKLKLISVLATGVNIVDLEAAKKRKIRVCNVPGYSTASTAQHAFALLLELTNHVGAHSQSVHAGDWQASPSFSYFRKELTELEGLTLGISGLGAIGKRMAEIGQAFGMQIHVHQSPHQSKDVIEHVSKTTCMGSVHASLPSSPQPAY